MLSRITFKKIGWLFGHPEFRRSPVMVGQRVLGWELVRARNKDVVLELDSMRLKVRSQDGVGRLLYYFGEQSDELLMFLGMVVEPGMVVVDVGANIGTVSVFCSQLVGQDGKVVAVEADESTAALLEENLTINKCTNAEVRRTCVSDSIGVADFVVNADSAKRSLVGGLGRRIAVETTTLDRLLRDMTRMDILKIDVEGADYRVLLGAAATIDRLRPRVIVVETLADKDRICSFLLDRGYSLRAFDSQTRHLETFETVPLNLYAVRDVESMALRPQSVRQV